MHSIIRPCEELHCVIKVNRYMGVAVCVGVQLSLACLKRCVHAAVFRLFGVESLTDGVTQKHDIGISNSGRKLINLPCSLQNEKAIPKLHASNLLQLHQMDNGMKETIPGTKKLDGIVIAIAVCVGISFALFVAFSIGVAVYNARTRSET